MMDDTVHNDSPTGIALIFHPERLDSSQTYSKMNKPPKMSTVPSSRVRRRVPILWRRRPLDRESRLLSSTLGWPFTQTWINYVININFLISYVMLIEIKKKKDEKRKKKRQLSCLINVKIRMDWRRLWALVGFHSSKPPLHSPPPH